MDKFDINKPCATRGGHKVRDLHVLTSPIYGGDAIIGVIEESDPWVTSWTANGQFDAGVDEHRLDLVNVPEKRTVKGWLNVYDDHHGMDLSMVHPSKAQADLHSSSFRKRIACIEREITYTVGEGL